MIEIAFVDREIPDLDSEFFVLWLSEVVRRENHDLGDINLIFCSDEYLLKVNQDFLDHDYYTDIITFDYSEGKFISGDLFISLDRVRDNASGLSVEFESELKRVCVHGVLHLLGYKDKSDDEIIEMRGKEDYYLKMSVSRGT